MGLSGCTEAARPSSQPSFYADLGQAGARLDTGQARAMISAYRLNAGLGQLALDPALQAAAEREASRMAAADRPASADAVKQRLASKGIRSADANLSAGYRTLAEAFSGWRDSVQHDQVLKSRVATRMGIAAAHAPASKYKVYWALLVAP
ncbi:MAG: CAP domain-containing protein [Beijerinckiaceae bacterium]|nr:CAP domain-containing protein [Beijerinckiaceae bacterium]